MTSPALAATQAALKVRPLSATVAADGEPGVAASVGTRTHAASSATRRRRGKGTKEPPESGWVRGVGSRGGSRRHAAARLGDGLTGEPRGADSAGPLAPGTGGGHVLGGRVHRVRALR